jgi:hypothetical protein
MLPAQTQAAAAATAAAAKVLEALTDWWRYIQRAPRHSQMRFKPRLRGGVKQEDAPHIPLARACTGPVFGRNAARCHK